MKTELYAYFHHYRIPKVIRFKVLNEMIEYGWFKDMGNEVKIL